MQKQLKRTVAIYAAIAVAVLGGATIAAARQGVVTFPLYQGGTGSVDLSAWGSGEAKEVDKPVLVGSRAIRITTQGLYQGGMLTFKQPIDLSAAFGNAKTYLRMQARFDTSQLTNLNFNDPFAQRVASSPFDRMRYVLTMADGSHYELIRPVVLPRSEDPDSYVPLSFPVAAILKKGDGSKASVPTGDGAKVKSIAIFGDKYSQFYIGEMEVLTDDTEINASPIEEPIVYVNDNVTFSGAAEGGASTLHYSWDFDASDGIQEDAVGRSVSHVFKTAGKVTVTLTVSDEDGIKKPDSTSVTFDVTQ